MAEGNVIPVAVAQLPADHTREVAPCGQVRAVTWSLVALVTVFGLGCTLFGISMYSAANERQTLKVNVNKLSEKVQNCEKATVRSDERFTAISKGITRIETKIDQMDTKYERKKQR